MARLQSDGTEVLALFAQHLRDLGLIVMPVTQEHLTASRESRRDFGLLTADSLLIAAMRALSIVHLATNNGDFDTVVGIVCWNPAPA